MTPEREAEIRLAPLKSFDVVDLLAEIDRLRSENDKLRKHIGQSIGLLKSWSEDPRYSGFISQAWANLCDAFIDERR